VIPDAKIAEIRERADIAEVIGDYVTLKRAGANLKGVCPFHADSDPSFNVNPARQFYHCFGCGASGDVFKFLQQVEGLQFMEAVERLAGKFGVELPARPMSPEAKTAEDRARAEVKRRLYIVEEAAAFFEEQCKTANGASAMLTARGINEEIRSEYRMGFAPDSWDALLKHLQSKRISAREAEQVGLVVPRKNSDGYYDRFRNRLVFVITNPAGHPIAFSARVMDGDDASQAKYINSPETREYTKGKTLFGLHQARVSLSKSREAILVEGNFDVLAMAQAGFKNVVAPLGTALTKEQAAILRRRVSRVSVMFDGDLAGRKAAARAFPILAGAGLAAYVVMLPEGEDPDSLVRRKGRASIQSLLDGAKGLLDEIIRASAAASDKTAQDVARRIGKLALFLNAVTDSMERSVYRQRIAEAFGVDPQIVFRHLRYAGSLGKVEHGQVASTSEVSDYGTAEERELLCLMLDLPELTGEVSQSGAITMMRTKNLREIADKLVMGYNEQRAPIAQILSELEGEKALEWLARRSMNKLYKDESKGRDALREITVSMRQRSLDEQIKVISDKIKEAHASVDDVKTFELMRQRTELEKERAGANQAFDKD